MSLFDTNINNYTIPELFAIINLEEDALPYEIDEVAVNYIKKYKSSNPTISLFFQKIREKLIDYSIHGNNENEDIVTQTVQWNKNQVIPQKDKNQKDKITDRKQKIDIYDNEHLPMKQEQLGISNNYNVEISQDVLNPNLKNVTTRLLNLDSQFRQATNSNENTSSDYTLDLNDPLTNVLSMRLFSYQITYSWYTIDKAYGNTCFWITLPDTSITALVSIEPGNYSPDEFVIALNEFLKNTSNGFTFNSSVTPVTFNKNNGKITLHFYSATYTYNNITYNIDETSIITFFDPAANLMCENNCLNQNYIDQTLGWVMGFRLPYVNVINGGNTAPAILNLNGPKYLILVIDDYNQNHINNGLVSITELSKKLKLPNYYSSDLPYTCDTVLNTSNLQQIIQGQENNPDIGLLVADKLDLNYKTIPTVKPSAPRVLTQSQIYTINEIIKNNENNTNFRSKAPTSNDVFAILPVKSSGENAGTLLVEFSGSLQDNKRIYFGPVDIDRMAIKLLDDKGNVLNLNGNDWCVTLVCECLYQY